MKDLTEAKIAIFVNTRINVRNFHAKYWLATTIRKRSIRGRISHGRFEIFTYTISFRAIQIFFHAVYLYTSTRSHRITSPCNRHIANNHQTENISSTFDKSTQSTISWQCKNTKQKKNNEEKKRRGKDEKKDRNDNIIVGSQNRCNIKDQTFRIAMLHRKQKKTKKKKSHYYSTYSTWNRGNKSMV